MFRRFGSWFFMAIGASEGDSPIFAARKLGQSPAYSKAKPRAVSTRRSKASRLPRPLGMEPLERRALLTGVSLAAIPGGVPDLAAGAAAVSNATVASPVISVLLGKTVVTSGQSTIDYGTGILGLAGASKTFTIRNSGTQPLVLTTPFASTPHFTVSKPSKTTLAPGKTATFTVTLKTTEAWTGSEQVSLGNNDAAENPFTFTVTADVVPLVMTINNASIEDGKAGGKLVFSVSLSTPSHKAVTVHYATSNGTAIAGTDYTATHGTLTFLPNQTHKTIAVAVKGNFDDDVVEADGRRCDFAKHGNRDDPERHYAAGAFDRQFFLPGGAGRHRRRLYLRRYVVASEQLAGYGDLRH